MHGFALLDHGRKSHDSPGGVAVDPTWICSHDAVEGGVVGDVACGETVTVDHWTWIFCYTWLSTRGIVR